jgi:hypothetical protein
MNSTNNLASRTVRIGGASGYWGDTASGPRQLVELGNVHYLCFDYLAESTMAVLAKAKAKNPQAGYATDFIDLVMKPLLPEIMRQKIRVVANAGGVNLQAARDALEAVAHAHGLSPRIAIVEGDDLSARAAEFRERGMKDWRSGEALPEKITSINAYLGAFPIAAALDSGADIVLTGRVVDSAVFLGPLIHEFGWQHADYDQLAAGSLCGHLLECGVQVAGGNFTDWRETVDDWAIMGYPIAEANADGSFVVTKPEGTGGLVNRLTVGEQLLYEIGDPRAYLLPDVTCDFSNVTLDDIGVNRVRVSGVRGRAPTPTLKVCATYSKGFACRATTSIIGIDAWEKARRKGEAILIKTADELQRAGFSPLEETQLDVLGSADGIEAVLRIAVRHGNPKAAELFAREFVGAGLSMSPGITPLAPGRPGVSPLVQAFSFLLDKAEVPVTLHGADGTDKLIAFEGPYLNLEANDSAPASAANLRTDNWISVPLVQLAVARSGDKGNDANIGVLARSGEYLDYIRAALQPELILQRYAPRFGARAVDIYELPGLAALNIVLRDTLGDGGAGSLHHDPLAKTYSQRLLDFPIRIPADLLSANTFGRK